MTHFAAIAVLDVWPLSASLRSRLHLFDDSAPPGEPQRIVVRGRHEEDGETEWQALPELEKWPHLRNVLSRIMRLDQHKNFEMGRVTIEMLGPGKIVPWRQRPPTEWATLHLPIVTNPRAMMFADGQSMHLTAGVLTWVNNAVLCSEINLGATPRIHLVIEVRARRDG